MNGSAARDESSLIATSSLLVGPRNGRNIFDENIGTFAPDSLRCDNASREQDLTVRLRAERLA